MRKRFLIVTSVAEAGTGASLLLLAGEVD